MAATSGEDGDGVVLSCGSARAEISAVGAELRAWRVQGVDLLWRPDPKVWPAVCPVLFPIVGRLREDRLRVGPAEFSMGVHGFAADSRFSIESVAPDAASFLLSDSPASRASFPFPFLLRVSYRLGERALSTTLEVCNSGVSPLPYACGLHPGFRWPFEGGRAPDYYVEFETAESNLVPEITPEGLFGSTTRPIPLLDRSLPLSRDLFLGEALCFLNVRSRRFRLVGPSGRSLRIEASDFPHFALWSRPPAPYLCLECWTGHGDPVDFRGDLDDKPSMRRLSPGESARHEARFAFG